MKLTERFAIRIILVLFGCLTILNMNGQDLTKHKWKNRILIIKSSDLKSKKYQEQIKEFENSSDLIDRKIILYTLIGDEFLMVNYNDASLNTSGKISGKLAGQILKEKEEFEVILIGLDGGLKLQQTEILTKENLFSRIDSMPMRQFELNKN